MGQESGSSTVRSSTVATTMPRPSPKPAPAERSVEEELPIESSHVAQMSMVAPAIFWPRPTRRPLEYSNSHLGP